MWQGWRAGRCGWRAAARALSTTAAGGVRVAEDKVVVVGGGVVGSATALHLAEMRGGDGSQIVVVERDAQYTHASATLSAGGIRQQFSNEENVRMSMYGAEFVKDAERRLSMAPEDLQFHENGYLFLAATPEGKQVLVQNQATQHTAGAEWIQLMDPSSLSEKFPWLTCGDLHAGAWGSRNEGWFDPWALLAAMIRKNKEMGVTYVNGMAEGIQTSTEFTTAGAGAGSARAKSHVEGVWVAQPDKANQPDGACAYCEYGGAVVNAAGAFAANVVQMIGEHVAELPVRPRRRSMFFVDCPEDVLAGSDLCEAPLTVDPSGVYFRPEGKGFVCGVSPPAHEDADHNDLEALNNVDYHLFEEIIWPALYHRVPAFGQLKVQTQWAGFYEFNTVDQNAIIGPHPDVPNLFLANGFSGHGLQQAPAAGRAVAEYIVHGDSTSLDLQRFRFERFLTNEPVLELNIV